MIKSEMVYWTVCDRCGREYEGLEESCGSSQQRAVELADSYDWAEINGRHLCSYCWEDGENGEPVEKSEEVVA